MERIQFLKGQGCLFVRQMGVIGVYIEDNEVGSHDICNLFKNKYKSLYSSVQYDEKEMKHVEAVIKTK